MAKSPRTPRGSPTPKAPSSEPSSVVIPAKDGNRQIPPIHYRSRETPTCKRIVARTRIPVALGLQRPRRNQVLDHHRSRPLGDDDPSPRRLLISNKKGAIVMRRKRSKAPKLRLTDDIRDAMKTLAESTG